MGHDHGPSKGAIKAPWRATDQQGPRPGSRACRQPPRPRPRAMTRRTWRKAESHGWHLERCSVRGAQQCTLLNNTLPQSASAESCAYRLLAPCRAARAHSWPSSSVMTRPRRESCRRPLFRSTRPSRRARRHSLRRTTKYTRTSPRGATHHLPLQGNQKPEQRTHSSMTQRPAQWMVRVFCSKRLRGIWRSGQSPLHGHITPAEASVQQLWERLCRSDMIGPMKP